jgi:ELWxxDGT repeat protein
VLFLATAVFSAMRPIPLHAQVSLVKDISTVPSPYYESRPGDFVTVGTTTLFTAESPGIGRELWKTDATPQGTMLVKDVGPDGVSSIPNHLTAANGLVFFAAFDADTQRDLLWRSDGTANGTVMIQGIVPDLFYHPVEYDGALFFAADDGIHGSELWRSDGTAEGTRLVKDINPAGGSRPLYLTTAGGTLFFFADDGEHGIELWRSDGTEAGTVLVEDITPGAGGSAFPDDPDARQMWAVDNIVFFAASDGVHGTELWKSDGTEIGTALVKDINPGAADSTPGDFATLNHTLFFRATDDVHGTKVWKSDGTEAGTVLVRDIGPDQASSFPSDLVAAGGLVFFGGSDQYPAPSDPGPIVGVARDELWVTDGTETGTRQVKDIKPGDPGSNPRELTVIGDTLFFSADDGDGRHLWKSDGTETGTVLVKPVFAENLANANGTLLFSGSDGRSGGRELWRSDGSADGTQLVKDINFVPGSSSPQDLTSVGGELFFTADDGITGRQLWKSDGTEAGTARLSEIVLGDQIDPSLAWRSPDFTTVDGTVFFVAGDPGYGFELWKSDGTAAGTALLKDIRPGPDSAFSPLQHESVNSGGRLFFAADDGTTGVELWKSDGTEAGTTLVADLNPGPASSSPSNLTDVGGTLFFSTYDATGIGVWKSDGTADGTQRLATGFHSSVASLTNVAGTLYFVVDSTGLWKSAGTPAGTVRVRAGLVPQSLTAVDGTLFFVSSSTGFGAELWRSDGTFAGTVRVKDINQGAADAFSFSSELVAVDGQLFFVADDGLHGPELWKSDGTTAGTVLVKDIVPGSAGSQPFALQVVNGQLFFLTEENGQVRLWKSDGTAAGTTIVQPLAGNFQFPEQPLVAVVGTSLFFNGEDPTVGRELWAVDLTAPPAACVGDCHGDGTVTVDELITGVNIALGNVALSQCVALDVDGNGAVTVNELITAVNNALSGCP